MVNLNFIGIQFLKGINLGSLLEIQRFCKCIKNIKCNTRVSYSTITTSDHILPGSVLQFKELLLTDTHCTIFTVRNEVAKVMFLHVSVSHSVQRGKAIPACIAGGIPACLAAGVCVLSQHALQVVSQHALPAPGGVCSSGGACSRGGGCGDPPKSRQLLLQMVRILLECILVKKKFWRT